MELYCKVRIFNNFDPRFLSAPCTSTDSARVFSAASHFIFDKRNRLSCEKAEKLLYIKKNLPLFLKK